MIRRQNLQKSLLGDLPGLEGFLKADWSAGYFHGLPFIALFKLSAALGLIDDFDNLQTLLKRNGIGFCKTDCIKQMPPNEKSGEAIFSPPENHSSV